MKSRRRHSNSTGDVTCAVHCPAHVEYKHLSRRATVSSEDTASAFGVLEYSTMIDAWVGDCWGEMEDQLMRLSGNDFKAFALASNVPSDQESGNRVKSQVSLQPNFESVHAHTFSLTSIEGSSENSRSVSGGTSPSRFARINSRR